MATSNDVRNIARKNKGKVKEAAGKLTGNAKAERNGQIDQVKAGAKQTVEKVKDVLKK